MRCDTPVDLCVHLEVNRVSEYIDHGTHTLSSRAIDHRSADHIR